MPAFRLLALALLLGAIAVAVGRCDLARQNDDRPAPDPGSVTGCDGQRYPGLSETPYVLPFPVGAGYRMNLGNCSSSFHSPSRPDRYGYDFNTQIGDVLTAARPGRVVRVEESGTDGSRAVNNLVVVDHGDDTFASYMHLTNGGADVAVGDVVARGDRIGRSGSTGLAGYPHLHFIVTRGGHAYPYDPVPVSFSNAEPAHVVLIEGQRYAAQPYP